MNAFKTLQLDNTMIVAAIAMSLAAGWYGYTTDAATQHAPRVIAQDTLAVSPDHVFRIVVTAPRELAATEAGDKRLARS